MIFIVNELEPYNFFFHENREWTFTLFVAFFIAYNFHIAGADPSVSAAFKELVQALDLILFAVANHIQICARGSAR